MREFCEFRNLIPRGIKLSPEDIWDRAAFILSVKMQEPQFAGQTKEKAFEPSMRRICVWRRAWCLFTLVELKYWARWIVSRNVH